MDLGSIFIISALFLMTIFFIMRPFFDTAIATPANAIDIAQLIEEQERILEDLRDLDLDHSLGKIPDEEYPAIRNRLLHQGAEILHQIDRIREDRIPEDQIRSDPNESIAAGKDDMGSIQIETISDPLSDKLETKIAERRRMKQEKATSFCPHCGSPILKSDLFCWKCGHKID